LFQQLRLALTAAYIYKCSSKRNKVFEAVDAVNITITFAVPVMSISCQLGMHLLLLWLPVVATNL
jgi:hypothetical protein